jgi:tetratricopeptide (TPR) repeat protein
MLCCLAALYASPCPAAQAGLWLQQATEFYKAENYDSAAEYYRKIEEAGIRSGDIYYNLGNCYFRQNRLGHAILYFEKARVLSPNDADIVHNLRFARLNIVDRVPEPQRGFLESVLRSSHMYLSLDIQLWSLTALFAALCLLFSAGLFVSRNARLWIVYASALVVAGMLLLAVSAGTKIYHRENANYAVVLGTSVDAMNAPDGDKVLFTAHEGTTFRLRKEMDQWVLASLPNGVSGWVDSSLLGRI